MNLVPDKSVHLVITSPPYWQLKDDGTENQIGYHEDYETYINNLNLVWKECYRVLDNGCRLCVNIGDQFARAVYYGRYKVIPIRTEIIKFCESIGFDYMGAIIWQKQTTTNTTGGASLMGSFPTPRNGILSIDYEFILIFKKLGTSKSKVSKEINEQSKLTTEEWKEYFSGHWNFGGARQDGHIAMFPEELPKRLIKMFAFNVDFYIKIKEKYIGLQIKPVNQGIQLSQIFKEKGLQQKTHEKFENEFGGKVFYIFSSKANGKKVIRNPDVIEEIRNEINRLEQ